MAKAKRLTASIGVIGGSGIYEIDGVKKLGEVKLTTPFGAPSDSIAVCEIAGKRVAFLPRHARGHRILPSEVNTRANMWALKSLGVEQIIAFSAVGSLKAALPPRHFVVPDQVIDKTFRRPGTFYGDGVVAHVAFAHPFCDRLRRAAVAAAKAEKIAVTAGGTYVCMEGPQFSTRAESNLHRSWGAALIGMTCMPEAKLAREAEMCYAVIALVTDFDCWKEDEEHVTADAVVATMTHNVQAAKRMLPRLIAALDAADCSCRHALAGAIMSDPKRVPPATRKKLALLAGKYLKQ
ncbi:MAG TPA: S-methyl-5'-thioadenosine phosphorylase [bacterium]|nr:S-methyl-5'-thioadenosine phosphorylase [bacterium]